MNCELEYSQQLPGQLRLTSCITTDLNDTLISCCGTLSGAVLCFELRRNVLIASVQVLYYLIEALQHTNYRYGVLQNHSRP